MQVLHTVVLVATVHHLWDLNLQHPAVYTSGPTIRLDALTTWPIDPPTTSGYSIPIHRPLGAFLGA